MPHVRQSRPDSGLGLQVHVLKLARERGRKCEFVREREIEIDGERGREIERERERERERKREREKEREREPAEHLVGREGAFFEGLAASINVDRAHLVRVQVLAKRLVVGVRVSAGHFTSPGLGSWPRMQVKVVIIAEQFPPSVAAVGNWFGRSSMSMEHTSVYIYVLVLGLRVYSFLVRRLVEPAIGNVERQFDHLPHRVWG